VNVTVSPGFGHADVDALPFAARPTSAGNPVVHGSSTISPEKSAGTVTLISCGACFAPQEYSKNDANTVENKSVVSPSSFRIMFGLHPNSVEFSNKIKLLVCEGNAQTPTVAATYQLSPRMPIMCLLYINDASAGGTAIRL